jgi:glycosyltransferase involved in cell wall biosynthesis
LTLTESPIKRPGGITILICAYNAVNRLGPTLAHLAAQQGLEGVAWEVLLVDNNSTDGTADVARHAWKDVPGVDLRVVTEITAGIGPARARGLAEARFELVGMVDDDNWLAANWIRTAVDVMQAHPEVGACGGHNEAVYEMPPPPWLPQVAAALAIGPQGARSEDVTESRGLLWGAGLVVRLSAWEQAVRTGMGPRLTGRHGAVLASGEDSELCLLLRAAGWRLWYEPRLMLKHYLPEGRLNWEYLRAVHRGSGGSSAELDGYHLALRHHGPWTFTDRCRWSWPWQALRALQCTLRDPVKRIASLAGALEGDPDVLSLEESTGRFLALLRLRGDYPRRVREITLRARDAA